MVAQNEIMDFASFTKEYANLNGNLLKKGKAYKDWSLVFWVWMLFAMIAYVNFSGLIDILFIKPAFLVLSFLFIRYTFLVLQADKDV